MRILGFLLLTAITSLVTLHAAPCSTGTLADYIALGTAGCTVGGDTFFNFQLVGADTTGGSVAIGASDIEVAGLGPAGTLGASALDPYVGNDLGINFNAAWSVVIGQSLDDTIAFDVSVGNGAVWITDAGVIQDSVITGNGSAEVSEKGCSGLVFPCTQTWGVASNNDSFIADTIFSATGTLSVEKDIALIGGNGDASFLNVADVFSTSDVPEPRGEVLMLGLLLLVAACWRLRAMNLR